MFEQTISVDRMEQAVSLFGSFDENIRLIEQHYAVSILSRDSDLKVTGEPEAVAKAVRAIGGLRQLINRGEQLGEQNVRYVLMLVDEGGEAEIPQLTSDSICITSKGRPVKPKTIGQKTYVEAIKKNTIVLGVGPAGTGKTYLCLLYTSTIPPRTEWPRHLYSAPVPSRTPFERCLGPAAHHSAKSGMAPTPLLRARPQPELPAGAMVLLIQFYL